MFRHATENARQGLVNGIKRDGALNAILDIEIDFRIARQREQNLLRGNIGYHHAISFGFWNGNRKGKRNSALDSGWDVNFAQGRYIATLDMLVGGLVHKLGRLRVASVEQHANQACQPYFAGVHLFHVRRPGIFQGADKFTPTWCAGEHYFYCFLPDTYCRMNSDNQAAQGKDFLQVSLIILCGNALSRWNKYYLPVFGFLLRTGWLPS